MSYNGRIVKTDDRNEINRSNNIINDRSNCYDDDDDDDNNHNKIRH